MLQILKTQVRREFWEHRALWMAPLAVAALMLLGALIGHVNIGLAYTPEQRKALFGVLLWGFSMPEYLTLGIIMWMYAGECLYGERRDRSILFWKSMPVSDSQTVLSKLLVACVILPLGVYALNLVIGLLTVAISEARSWAGQVPSAYWDTATWLRVQWMTLVGLVAVQLWYAPIIAFLMMVSAWARRNVQLWVFLPPLVAMVVERIVFRTHYLGSILTYRLDGVFMGPLLTVLTELKMAPGPDTSGTTLDRAFAAFDPSPAFANIDLWLGLVVAAVFIVVAIRIRQYRDDT